MLLSAWFFHNHKITVTLIDYLEVGLMHYVCFAVWLG